MPFYENKNVLVTGGAGFIGSHLAEELAKAGALVTIAARDTKSPKIRQNLRDMKLFKFADASLEKFSDCRKIAKGQEIIFNLASNVAGIQYNISHPGSIFTENALINVNMLEAARLADADRFLVVSSACVYPHDAITPTPESEGFRDDPEPTNYGYGWSKRLAEVQAKAYFRQYGMKIGIARPFNAYGPRDKFDDETSHVIPAIIKKAFSPGNVLAVWGSGKQTRSFIYASDFVQGLLLTCEKYAVADAVNIGGDEEITIENLARLVIELSGTGKKIVFDRSYPDGQPKRASDNGKAKKELGFSAKVPLREGIALTMEWYKEKYLQGGKKQ